MTIPMPDLPEHFPIPIDEQGRGPVALEDAAEVMCWCGETASDCDQL